MGYWLVMAIVALAVVVILIAVAAEEDESEPRSGDAVGRPVWVAIGTNGNPPDDAAAATAPHWIELVRRSLGERVICYDFTTAGCTAEEAQREQLAAAVAAAPDGVTVFLGPDDFRDAEDLGVFERRLWHMLATLRDAESVPLMAALPDLTGLPSLVAEENPEGLTEELQSWNVAIARLVAAAGGEFVDLGEAAPAADGALFTESAGRFILTAAGHAWFAALMEPAVRRLFGLTDALDTVDVADAASSDAK
jgi:hypothetical protein